ncbi:MAG: hypothetical protein IPN42_01850 [Methylococcaceae bacterium]|nr:hypothetical protein [Methylococcaceae bacterium]
MSKDQHCVAAKLSTHTTQPLTLLVAITILILVSMVIHNSNLSLMKEMAIEQVCQFQDIRGL